MAGREAVRSRFGVAAFAENVAALYSEALGAR
jgi:hypothetical protein